MDGYITGNGGSNSLIIFAEFTDHGVLLNNTNSTLCQIGNR